ncbi:hypothetical protein [Campylobacter helveticus]|uniref:hypothetical protein n=1 Tax=Campylobacter helveticus TaxID=28898 RepID=UPI0009C20C63|nr:hypothetical protein [Campylobacter helveticus]ARE81456.1 hypothetical protein CHELV3228_a0083 [Campylobacter helveticus]SMC25324.1 hypothetical protein SAMN02745125_01993 [Campylobacter helveticus]SUW87691.1 Uncharacterised protein [Campylobacter helveticus]
MSYSLVSIMSLFIVIITLILALLYGIFKDKVYEWYEKKFYPEQHKEFKLKELEKTGKDNE